MRELTFRFLLKDGKKPPEVCQDAVKFAKNGGYSVVIIDTAGRSQLDQELMDELKAINSRVKAVEILLVVDAMIGQEALHVAEGFRDSVSITGLVMAKMDGDARGGAAISVRSVTGVPIKFLGTGEGIDAMEAFDPARLSSRILGMGDVIGLIEKAEQAFDQDDAQAQAAKMMKGDFTLEDFLSQLKQIKKMGSISQILEMMPGSMGQLAKNVNPNDAENQMKYTEAIINSMTNQEEAIPRSFECIQKT